MCLVGTFRILFSLKSDVLFNSLCTHDIGEEIQYRCSMHCNVWISIFYRLRFFHVFSQRHMASKCHSPDLACMEFNFAAQEYKWLFWKIDKNEFLPFLTDCDEYFMCVVCFWRMQKARRDEEGAVTHFDEILVFCCFRFKNE